MLMHKIALALAVTSLIAAETVPRTPKVTGGCPIGYRLTQKFCADDDEPAVCCPSKGKHSCFNDYEKCIPQVVGCPIATFGCPEEFGGNCCPDNSFCGFLGPEQRYVCFV
ncbi:hypothetical protein BKA57DRAFT_234974 [Linnemannia elongata]|nr:hypothetical protein BKA57DRAFT_234974 [Linnemannia elongata]